MAEWNEIAPPYTINVGQVIKLFKPENTPAVQSVRNPPQRRKTGDSVKFQNSAQPADSDNPNAKKRTASQKKLSIISDNKKKVLKLYWQWPLKGKLLKTFTQTGRKGIDIFAEEGASVRSSSSGKVVYSGQGLIGYGNLLIIKHNEQFLSAYGNNRKLLVSEGQFVEGGQVIAEVGVGSDKKPSLHFEIRKYGKPVNPLLYLPK
ncbi:MAG: peptidoglycan DD-metalloendopeptidase family protein [Gammaproteobacteria bacterium]